MFKFIDPPPQKQLCLWGLIPSRQVQVYNYSVQGILQRIFRDLENCDSNYIANKAGG